MPQVDFITYLPIIFWTMFFVSIFFPVLQINLYPILINWKKRLILLEGLIFSNKCLYNK